MRSEFIEAIKTHQTAFSLNLPEAAIDRLADYYQLILEHNDILHLIGPMTPEEFAIRHILESLTLLEYLPHGARFADVGSGGGLPSIPCLLVREDLGGILIESKLSKSGFLQKVLADCKLSSRAQIFGRQFSELQKPAVSYVTCRALDKFAQKLPQLIRWSGNCHLLLFGGESLRNALLKAGMRYHEKLMPMSEKRFLFHAPRK